MGKIGFVFSGQGAQYAGMGKDIYENYDAAKDIFDRADKLLGYKISDICFYENPEELNKTENTQPAILTLSIALKSILDQENIKADIASGLSLGEYSALVANGTIKFEEAVILVRKRGKYMEEAVPAGIASMKAIIGLSEEEVLNICNMCKDKGIVEISNLNCPGQIVIGGEIEALEKAETLAKEFGAKSVVQLNVQKPFHTSMLESAAIKLAKEMENITLNKPNIPVVTNVTGECIYDYMLTKELLINQVKATVKFEKCINTMIDYGVDTFIEIGPGKALCGFVRKINRKLNILNVEDTASILKTIEKIKNL
jgi:[acyl-carrier-protein] S-malonyltransferase